MSRSTYCEFLPAYVGEKSYTITLRLPGEGDISTWTFAGFLYAAFQEIPGMVAVAVNDPIARTITVTVTGQTAPNAYTWEVRRTDDDSNLVTGWGIIDVSDPARNGAMAGGPWVGWEVVQLRIADAIDGNSQDMYIRWAGVCARGARDAAFDIATRLALSGYGPAEINAADQIVSWNERLAAYYAVKSRATLTKYDLNSVEQWNVIPDIDKQLNPTAAILIGGVPTAPQLNSSQIANISTGRFAAADQDRVNREYERWEGRGARGPGGEWW